jgi:Xaa-Pro dipeptidase
LNSSVEISKRKKRLAKWLHDNDFRVAVFLKEELETTSGNFIYYGGAQTSGEYCSVMVDSVGNSYAIVHEYSYERVVALGMYDAVYEIRQSMHELISCLKRFAHDKLSTSERIAFDLDSTKVKTLNQIENSGIKVWDNKLTNFVYSERAFKSPYEIEEMQNAVRLAKLAFERTLGVLKEGQSTAKISKLLSQNLIEEGALAPSFEPDVRFRRGLSEMDVQNLRRGDLILFDFGARLPSMYLSDVGRTIPFGTPSKDLKDLLGDAIDIKRRGLREIRSGKSGNEIRAAIDKLIEEFGYVSTHRPGHQIGLNVHEPYEPHLAYGSENALKLASGYVVTWEPGLGLRETVGRKNRFGMVHIEDMVLVGGSSKLMGNFDLQYW